MRSKWVEKLKSLVYGPLRPLAYVAEQCLIWGQYWFYRMKWLAEGRKLPDEAQQKLIRENVTFIFKSFQRQPMARRLYRNIQKYYPGVRVVIADDSEKPLELSGPGLEVVHLPFNSGLSRGLNQALARVQTPYAIRMDDDELLTPDSVFHEHLLFLMEHPEVDLVGVMPRNLNSLGTPEQGAQAYYRQNMADAPKQLRIPHGTRIAGKYIVLGKVPNIFIIRTEAYKQIGYDDNIRMMDHNDFFFRSAGNLVSVLDVKSYVFHYHNRFKASYQKYRSDVQGDRIYIFQKHYASRMVPQDQKQETASHGTEK